MIAGLTSLFMAALLLATCMTERPAATTPDGRIIIRLPRPPARSRPPVPTPMPPGDPENILRRAITDPGLLQKALAQPFTEKVDTMDQCIALNLADTYRRDPDGRRRLLEQHFIYDTESPERIAAEDLPPFSPRLPSITETRHIPDAPWQ